MKTAPDASPAGDIPASPAREKARHLPELDGVRGVAIVAVMALHFVYPLVPRSFLERAAHQLAGYGLWGVDLFFVLSGFLITGILHDEKGSPRYFRNFYLRRTLRIFPLYYAVLGLVLLTPESVASLVGPGILEARDVQAYLWTYLTNLHVAGTDAFSIPYLSHFWSLAVEEHFYLFWPFVVGLWSRRGALFACLVLSGAALALRIGLSLSGAHVLAPQVLTPCRLDALCIGGALALLTRGPASERVARLSPRGAVASFAGVIALSALHKLVPAWDPVVLHVRATLLALTFGLAITAAADPAGPRLLKAACRLRALRQLGKYSYGLYVFHGIVAYALETRRAPETLAALTGSHGLASLAYVGLGVGISLLLAVTSYELFELRFLRLKRYFEYSGVRTPGVERAANAELAGRGLP